MFGGQFGESAEVGEGESSVCVWPVIGWLCEMMFWLQCHQPLYHLMDSWDTLWFSHRSKSVTSGLFRYPIGVNSVKLCTNVCVCVRYRQMHFHTKFPLSLSLPCLECCYCWYWFTLSTLYACDNAIFSKWFIHHLLAGEIECKEWKACGLFASLGYRNCCWHNPRLSTPSVTRGWSLPSPLLPLCIWQSKWNSDITIDLVLAILRIHLLQFLLLRCRTTITTQCGLAKRV